MAALQKLVRILDVLTLIITFFRCAVHMLYYNFLWYAKAGEVR